jgi:hypothetical protein
MSITLPERETSTNPAVQRCLDAWHETFDALIAAGKEDWSASKPAHKAYRRAMPDPENERSIQDFIACVSRGILIGAISDKDAARLLYAAQVARQAQPNRSAENPKKKSVQPESVPAEGAAAA